MTPPPPMTRRERQRLATMDEIVTVARGLVAEGRELTVKAVAAQMGLTPPALYRYVASLADLMSLVIASVLRDLMGRLASARDRHPDDPAAQIVASAAAFRAWSLAHPHEFGLVFATPRETPPLVDPADDCVIVPGVADEDRAGLKGAEFSTFFGEIYLRLWHQRPFPVLAPADLDPAFVAMHQHATPEQAEMADLFGPDALGAFWTFEVAWAKLFGIVALEVYGHLNPGLTRSAVLFQAQMTEIGLSLGLGSESARLSAVIEQESRRSAE